jgi:hypothetical protein
MKALTRRLIKLDLEKLKGSPVCFCMETLFVCACAKRSIAACLTVMPGWRGSWRLVRLLVRSSATWTPTTIYKTYNVR